MVPPVSRRSNAEKSIAGDANGEVTGLPARKPDLEE